MQIFLSSNDIIYRYAHNAVGSIDPHTNHHHLDYELLIVLRGRGQFLIGSHAHAVSAGTIILVPPENYHIMNISENYAYERVVINFSHKLLPNSLNLSTSIVGKQTIDTENVTRRILEYQRKFDNKKFEMLLPSLISEFLVIFESQKEVNAISRERLPELIFKTINYVRNNIYQPLTAEIIAKDLFVSKSHLTNKFKETTATTLGDYIRIQKMLKARELLKQGMHPTTVCEKLGYTTYSTFLRNYRMEFGNTPKNINKREENSN